MPSISDSDVFKSIKEKRLFPIYFFYGEERYFIKKAVSQLKALVVPSGFEGFNLSEIEGEKLNVSQLEDCLDGLPVMTDRKCVILKDADIEKLAKDDFERLLSLVSNPSPDAVFIIVQLSNQPEMKKSAKYKKLLAAAEKSGAACNFEQKDALTLKRVLCQKAKEAYVELDMETAGALIERCSRSYEVLSNEMDKLIAYARSNGEPPYSITGQAVDECTVASIDASAFDLAKSVLSNDFNRAFLILDKLFFLRQEAVSIVSALSMAFADIYRAKAAVNAQKTPDQTAADFNYPKNRLFAVKNAFRDVKKFSAAQIRESISILYETDELLKSSKLEDRLVLEQSLGKMLLSGLEDAK